MISADKIMGKVQKYANSPVGKKRIDKFLNEKRKSGEPLASGQVLLNRDIMIELAVKFREIIYKHLPDNIKDVGTENNLVICEPVKTTGGRYNISLKFNKDVIRRSSLWEDGYPDGIENIVALLNNGYAARDYVYGMWKGKKVRSLLSRDGEGFMQDAVREFNNAYGKKYNVTAILGSIYTE